MLEIYVCLCTYPHECMHANIRKRAREREREREREEREREREIWLLPEGFEHESFTLKFNTTVFKYKIHYIEVDLHYLK